MNEKTITYKQNPRTGKIEIDPKDLATLISSLSMTDKDIPTQKKNKSKNSKQSRQGNSPQDYVYFAHSTLNKGGIIIFKYLMGIIENLKAEKKLSPANLEESVKDNKNVQFLKKQMRDEFGKPFTEIDVECKAFYSGTTGNIKERKRKHFAPSTKVSINVKLAKNKLLLWKKEECELEEVMHTSGSKESIAYEKVISRALASIGLKALSDNR